MFSIKYATEEHRSFWQSLDPHIAETELRLKIRDKRAYILKDGDRPIGVLRYNLFWDVIAFLNLLYLEESSRVRAMVGRRCCTGRRTCAD